MPPNPRLHLTPLRFVAQVKRKPLARTQFIRRAVNFLGDAIRDAMDPHIRNR
jgi:CO/xanthine dehydrogenase FAD-binding subunit